MFYERLKALLKERGLSDKQFLADVKLSKNTMTNWKNGVVPTHRTLVYIANYLGVSVEYLKGESEKKDTSTERKEQEDALLRMFRSTSEEGRLRIIQAVMNICDEEEKKSAAGDTGSIA